MLETSTALKQLNTSLIFLNPGNMSDQELKLMEKHPHIWVMNVFTDMGNAEIHDILGFEEEGEDEVDALKH